ncbi:Coatomer subunit alpha, partial [Trichinella pseudospiralis]
LHKSGIHIEKRTMLKKFEAKSARVKGLSFHPVRPWILASLHSGVIQMWDYQLCVLIEKYEEHDGPVRGICFHPQQPLFVSGGDDYKVKVWNYKQRRCLFNLIGHLDYVRTTFFHNKYPWIISASDDQTIRIWNWQSRSSIAIITGHNHYVMCAQFHPTDDLIVSGSLDQTVRIWDMSVLRKKNAAPGLHSFDDRIYRPVGQTDLFGQSDVIVKHLLEGHDRGVNWVTFHPTMCLVASAADDRQIKLWRYNESKAWEVAVHFSIFCVSIVLSDVVDVCRGHYNNVSCVLFHPRSDLILSDAEDKTIRVWDLQKRTCLMTFRQENSRFWILTAHPTLNLFAAGHDGGMVVFKIERERPAFTVYEENLFYVRDRILRKLNLRTSNDVPLISLRGKSHNPYYSLSYNPAEHSVIITTRMPAIENCVYDIYALPKKENSSENAEVEVGEGKRNHGFAALWIARNRYAVVDRSRNIIIKDVNHETVKTIELSSCEDIFYAGIGMLLIRDLDGMTLYDVQQKRVIATLRVASVRYVVWASDMSVAALLSKHHVTLVTRKLKLLCSTHESNRVKSGSWHNAEVFIYTTTNHIKYMLANGDNGIIRTLDVPLYITQVIGGDLICLNREAQPKKVSINVNEYMFKLALIRHQNDTVLQMVRNSNIIGQAIIAYLQKKGYPEIALHFVKDEKTRFGLALQCCSLDIAFEAAKLLDDRICWEALASAALIQGNHQIVETAYQRVKNFEKLSFLYFITGNVEKLKKMMKIAEIRKDLCGQFEVALLLGDVRERVRILNANGMQMLAFCTAKTHGLETEAAEIGTSIISDGHQLPQCSSNAKLLIPPPVIYRNDENWPHLTVSKGYFEAQLSKSTTEVGKTLQDPLGVVDADAVEAGEGWGEDEDLLQTPEMGDEEVKEFELEDEGGGWEVDDNIDLPPDLLELSSPTDEEGGTYVPPARQASTAVRWVVNTRLPMVHVVAGSFETAFQLLRDQIGVVNFKPFRQHFMALYCRSKLVLECLPVISPLILYPIKDGGNSMDSNTLPPVGLKMSYMATELQACYRLTTAGKFIDAVEHFHNLLLWIPLMVVDSRQEIREAMHLVEICREYLVGLNLELKRKEMPKEQLKDQILSAEMASYFTRCKLQPAHQMLTLRTAVNLLFKLKNYKTCSAMCRRLLECGPKEDVRQQMNQILTFCEKSLTDQHPMEYDALNPFEICAGTYRPIYRGKATTKCPFCGATYVPNLAGSVCRICRVAEIGRDCLGMTISTVELK